MAEQNTLNTWVQRYDWKAAVAEVEDLEAPHIAYRFSKKDYLETDSAGVYTDDE